MAPVLSRKLSIVARGLLFVVSVIEVPADPAFAAQVDGPIDHNHCTKR